MDLGRLLLRLVVGGTFFVHGTQKLFGWFGGHGPEGTGQFFESVEMRPGKRNAVVAGATETGSGVLLAAGVATPVAAAGITSVMITALRTVAWKDGIKPATGEHEVLLAIAALALAETGPGRLSAGSQEGSTHAMLAALAAGAAGSTIAINAGRSAGADGAPQPAPPAVPEAPPA